MQNNPFTSPNIDDAKLYASWGADISYMVNWCITPEQYKAITGKDYVAPTTQAPTTQAPTAQATTTSTTN